MIRYNFIRIIGLFVLLILFSSCLDNKVSDTEYSSDAQIYLLSATAAYDSTKALAKTAFSINQASGQEIIFNKDSLPYNFVIRNVKLSIAVQRASGIKLYLSDPDSVYFWNNSDSVALNRLKHIEVIAQDLATMKKYAFKLNSHKIDPDSIVWKAITANYLNAEVSQQKTLLFNNKFFTFFQSGTSLKCVSSPFSDGKTWSSEKLSGIPENYVLGSLFANDQAFFLFDTAGKVYTSKDGKNWHIVASPKPIKAIYGTLPSNTIDSILVGITDEETLKFAKTKDFTSFRIMNDIPTEFPVSEFSPTSINSVDVFTTKFMVIAGGKTSQNIENKAIWLVSNNDEQIRTAVASSAKDKQMKVEGASLFMYDDKLYLLSSEGEKNTFFISENYGISWKKADKRQELPALFKHRHHSTVIVDYKNNIWIFGGVSLNLNDSQNIQEVWKGRLNKLIVDE